MNIEMLNFNLPEFMNVVKRENELVNLDNGYSSDFDKTLYSFSENRENFSSLLENEYYKGNGIIEDKVDYRFSKTDKGKENSIENIKLKNNNDKNDINIQQENNLNNSSKRATQKQEKMENIFQKTVDKETKKSKHNKEKDKIKSNKNNYIDGHKNDKNKKVKKTQSDIIEEIINKIKNINENKKIDRTNIKKEIEKLVGINLDKNIENKDKIKGKKNNADNQAKKEDIINSKDIISMIVNKIKKNKFDAKNSGIDGGNSSVSKEKEKAKVKVKEINVLVSKMNEKITKMNNSKKEKILDVDFQSESIKKLLDNINKTHLNEEKNAMIDDSEIIFNNIDKLKDLNNSIEKDILTLSKVLSKNKDKFKNVNIKNSDINGKTVVKNELANILEEIDNFENSISKIVELFDKHDLEKLEVNNYKKFMHNFKSLLSEKSSNKIINNDILLGKTKEKFNVTKDFEVIKLIKKLENIALKHNDNKNEDKKDLIKKEPTFTNSDKIGGKIYKGSKTVNIKSNFADKFAEKVDMNKIIEQIKKGLKPPLKNEVTIQLKPEHLGKLKVMLVMENNNLKAHITTEHNSVQNSVLNHLNQLESALKEKGINLSNFSVNVENSSDFNNKNNSDKFNNKKNSKLKAVNFEEYEEGIDSDSFQNVEEIIENTNTNLNIKI